MYYGDGRTSLDDKGRITIPAKFRQIMEVQKQLVWYLTRGFDGNLLLYPHDEWQKIQAQLNQSSPMDPELMDFKRLLLGSTSEVMPDKQGRLAVAPMLRELAQLDHKTEVVVLGLGNYLEVWNADVWRAFEREKAQQYKRMAASIYGAGGAARNAEGAIA